MDGCLAVLSVGFEQARHLFLTNGRPRQLGQRFVLTAVIGERRGMGQQP